LGQNESDSVWRHQILFDTGSLLSCDDKNFRKEDLKNSRKQVFDETQQELLASQEKILPLLVEEGNFHR